MNVLHIDCSPRPDSHSRKMSAGILNRIFEKHPEASVVRRDLGAQPLPHATAVYATTLSSPATLLQPVPGALDLSESLIRELDAADVVIIGTPMHNLTVPSALKAWIDQILRAGRTFKSTSAGKVGLLRDRPVFVAVASGGVFSGEKANQPDFLTPYLSAVLGSTGLKDIQFFSVQASAFLDTETASGARERALADIDLSRLQLEMCID